MNHSCKHCLLVLPAAVACSFASPRNKFPEAHFHKEDAMLLMEMQAWLGTLPRTVSPLSKANQALPGR
jgi:hypothetical protein